MTGQSSWWERFGWLIGAVWVVFLILPAIDVIASDRETWVRALALAALIAHGGVYVAALLFTEYWEEWSDTVERRVLPFLATMIGLVVVVFALIGPVALGMLPYVVGLSAFTVRIRWALCILLASFAAVVVSALVYDLVLLAMLLLILAIGTFAILLRLFEEKAEEQRALERELDVVGERDRVARDVHDVVGHSLTAVTTKAELAERLIDADPEAARRELQQIQSLTRESLAEIRATIAGLRVARLADELERARSALTDGGIEANLPEGVDVVDPRRRIVCAWVLRESITNVVRHSAATRCDVELYPDGITVADDGRGTTGSADGNGIRGMRERVAGAGGSIEIGAPTEGTGTRIEVRL